MKDLKPIIFPDDVWHRPIIIAGPCSAESEQQVIDTACRLHRAGIKIFRAGIWKPRTKPGGFEGVGMTGLTWLQRVKSMTGMYIATEVATHEHVIAALDSGIDILWIGARTSANPFAMQEIADTISEINPEVPVLVKNPINPDLELWIGAMQRLYNAGVKRIAAIHRGFSIYGNHLYRNQPQWYIPIELHRRYPNLPIFHDPSHIGGKKELVMPLSQQAMDMGFDGLIIESHCNPESALSDKEQQLTPESLREVLSSIVIRSTNLITENLNNLRRQIDELDEQLVELLAKRMTICREIGLYKKENGMPVVQNNRYEQLLNSRIEQASRANLGDDFIKKILESIHEESVRQQIEIINSKQ